ncbi:nuclear transport factor 2 family protein [Candidatus Binatia bacterium]|nr:nuclear transport factor 2 family protein [Candidatus Binatia bacterium]
MTHEDLDVLAANAAFYRAFAARDLDAMEALWAHSPHVACTHPGWAALHGRDAVMASWRAILDGPDAPEISCSHESVIPGERMAVVLCVESLRGGSLAATNVFVREGSEWRIVHHHAGPIAPGRATGSGEDPPPFLN